MKEKTNLTPLKWGIIGCADIADNQLIPAIGQSETGVVLAVASRSAEKARTTAARHGIPRWYGSYEELLDDPDVNAVYVPLPNHLHKEWVIRAAEAGKHVLCEKPFAMNAGEAAEMADAGKKAGVRIAEAFMYRHHPRYSRAIEIVRSGKIGAIRSIHAFFTFDLSHRKGDIRFRPEMGGGSIYDDGCYAISAVRLLLGTEPEAVTVHSMYSAEHGNVDMMNTALLEFPGGVGATLQFGMWSDGRNEIQVLGSKGSLLIPNAFYYDPPAETVLLVDVQGDRVEEHFGAMNHYTLEVDDFGRSIRADQPLRYSSEDSVANMKVIDAALCSSKERIRAALPDARDQEDAHA